jgi:hypothetical protein
MPTNTPTRTPTNTPTRTPSPTSAVCQARAECNPSLTPSLTPTPNPIAQLAPYGVVPENVTGMPAWSYTELVAIKNGVAAIGLAFANHIGGNISPVDAFRLVMGVNTSGLGIIKVRRTAAPGCIYYIGTRVIECGNLEDMDGNPRAITEYVIAHEMGHVFTGETARGNNISLAAYINQTRLDQNAAIVDARGPVMSNFIQDDGDTVFRRGERGWGSGPGSNYTPNDDRNGEPTKKLFTDYQQNTAPYIPAPGDPRTPIEIAVDETAADMFLNWVYKSIDPNRGFTNKSWKPTDMHPATPNAFCNTTAGCPESNPLVAGQSLLGNSGDARMAWMQQKMEEIFVDHQWK